VGRADAEIDVLRFEEVGAIALQLELLASALPESGVNQTGDMSLERIVSDLLRTKHDTKPEAHLLLFAGVAAERLPLLSATQYLNDGGKVSLTARSLE
jgi:hypothetical protein